VSLSLFEAFGVEIEYMIVDTDTLDVRPVAGRLLREAARMPEAEVVEDSGGGPDPQPCEVALGPISWSNELVSHVVEFKTTEPVTSLPEVAPAMAASAARADAMLRPLGARLLPTAMHPWMDPAKEMTLWPYGHSEVYGAFDRIFSCTGHGWANLQSAHLNLPFAEPEPAEHEREDGEFGRLHGAVRLILPILPALAASSPIIEGRVTGLLDSRLDVYRNNQRRVPSVAGRVIPERVFTKRTYEGSLLEGIYRDLAPLDPDHILRHEWVNSRGAIARFSRNSIEIRVIDAQECPAADLAVHAATVGALKALVQERWSSLAAQRSFEVEPLERIFTACVRDADRAVITDRAYLAALGFPGPATTAGDLWRHLVESCVPGRERSDALTALLTRGPLARRILDALGNPAPGVLVPRERLREIYASLAACPVPAPGRAGGTVFGG
jgi:carboxylate-amine ligase